MSVLLTIVLMGVVTFVPRWLGLRLSGREVPPFWLRFFSYVPLAVFPALIVPEVADSGSELPVRLVALAISALVLLRFRALWAGLAGGMAAFWLLRAFL